MRLNNAIVVNTESPTERQHRISGWINCPSDCRVIIRFITKGDASNAVEGLHWAVKGGWYKYLPATGKSEYFSVSAVFDEFVHGDPEIRIERWFGTGKVELILQDQGLQPLTLFWGSDESFNKFKDSTYGLIERFTLSSCLVSAAEPISPVLAQRIESMGIAGGKSRELHSDITKNALEQIEAFDFDALVVDLESLCLPLAKVHGSFIEVTRDARSIGAVPLDILPIKSGSNEYLSVLKRSLEALLQTIRPRPVVIQVPGARSTKEASRSQSRSHEFETLLRNLHPEELGFLTIESINIEPESDELPKSHELEQLLERNMFTFDENMVEIQKPSRVRILNKFVSLNTLETIEVDGLPWNFAIEVDILATRNLKDRSLLLVLDLESYDGNKVSEDLGKFGLSRSKMDGIDYFKYLPSVQGSETVVLEIQLPKHIRCLGFSFAKIRDTGPVFISRIEVNSAETIGTSSPLNPSAKKEV